MGGMDASWRLWSKIPILNLEMLEMIKQFVSKSLIDVWEKLYVTMDIQIAIIPSILAVTFLGPSTYLHSLSNSNVLPLATWLASVTLEYITQAEIIANNWSNGSTQGSKLRSTIFVIIESGVALFSIQLARLIICVIVLETNGTPVNALQLIICIHQQLNVIIRLVIPTFYFTDSLALLGNNTYNHPCAGLNGTVFPRREFARRSCQESAL